MLCAACGKAIEGSSLTTTWEGETVHVVCPGIDYLTHPKHPYHAHIFWGEAVPGGYYNYNPEIPWAEVERQAGAYGMSVHREADGDRVFIVVDDDPRFTPGFTRGL